MVSGKRTALVTDGEQRAALAVVRSLGRAGYTVHVCSAQPQTVAGGSRYAKSERMVANPLTSPAQYVADVQAYVRDVHADVLIPMTEASLLAILPVRETFGGTLIPFPALDTFVRVSDKVAVLEAARHQGIAVPEQRVLATAEQAATFAYDELQYPIVVKPGRSVGSGHEATTAEHAGANSRAKFSVYHAPDAATLREILAELDPRAYPVMLQQRIVGPGIGIFVLLWDGKLVATFAHRRIREHPPSGGVSVYRESVPMNDDLLARSRALLENFDWQGVAMIEYKVDQATNVPYIMEINGRFWGSLQLAIDSGVNFPVLLLQAAAGEHPVPVTTYKTGVRSRWFLGEVNHLVTRMRHSDRALALPPGSPSRSEMFREFFTYHSSDQFEIFQMDDATPFWREAKQWVRDLLRLS